MSNPFDHEALARSLFPFGMWHDHPSGYERMIESNVELLASHIDAILAELAACRAKNKELHRRTQKAESAVLKAQPKPVDTWKSRERQQEADARDRMMAAVGRAAEQEK